MKYILLLLSIMICSYGKQFICPDCGEPFDGHECENCKYTEER